MTSRRATTFTPACSGLCLGSGGGVVALFKRGLMADAVEGVPRKPNAACRDPVVLTLEVDDVDAAVADLVGMGVTPAAEPTDQSMGRLRVAHLRDPCGNLVELNAPLRQ